MKKAYLLVYNDQLGTRDQVKEVLNSAPIITWRYDIPHCFYLVSESSAHQISDYLRQKLPSGRHVITEVSDNYWGYTTNETWYLLANKEVKPK